MDKSIATATPTEESNVSFDFFPTTVVAAKETDAVDIAEIEIETKSESESPPPIDEKANILVETTEDTQRATDDTIDANNNNNKNNNNHNNEIDDTILNNDAATDTDTERSKDQENENENCVNEETKVVTTAEAASTTNNDTITNDEDENENENEEEEKEEIVEMRRSAKETIASPSSSSTTSSTSSPKKGIWFPSKNKTNNSNKDYYSTIAAKSAPKLHSQDEQQKQQQRHHHHHHHQHHQQQQQQNSTLILSLPIDSLHSIASFLTPIEWTNFGLGNKGTNKICREIFRRVRMHGFRCATEVITAWKLGQHADSKELCALYVSAGVPIYPHSLGHSYHTLIWRLAIEAKHIQEQQQTINESSSNTTNSGTSTSATSDTASEITYRQTTTLRATATENSSNNVRSRLRQLDPFYSERDDSRMREELRSGSGAGGLTYLEEKALYNINGKENESEIDGISRTNRRRMSIDWRAIMHPVPRGLPHAQGLQRVPRIPPNNPHNIDGGRPLTWWNPLTGTGRDNVPPRRQVTRSNSFSGNRYRTPNVHLKIHRHLLDQHLLGRPGVNDGDGLMTTPAVNLSADFFHPFFSFRSSNTETIRYQNSTCTHSSSGNNAAASNILLPAYNQTHPPTTVTVPPVGIDDNTTGSATATTLTNAHSNNNSNNNDENLEELGVARRAESGMLVSTDDSDSDVEAEIVFPRPNLLEPTRLINLNEILAAEAAIQPPAMAPPVPMTTTSGPRASSTTMHSGGQGIVIHNNILSNIDLDVYSASSSGVKSNDKNATGEELINYLKARFAVYQRYLDRHFSNNDSDNFDECIMDLWDEFFPQTANIQYYDKHTAVPRISRLDKFLTKPCPKAIGIVQCEIERVKLGSKKKGVNMKGRFFPTYEYRLFIRHRPSDPTSDTDANNKKKVRRDTVLMMAKNRGRKHTENAGQTHSITSAKKGSNNYYLHLPQQDDLDLHYKSVNVLEDIPQSAQNGTGTRITTSEFSGLLGRLQSNFVGTEFQIFTPRPAMLKTKVLVAKSIDVRQSSSVGASSDEDMLYESGPPNEIDPSATARRRSRFRRLSLRGRSSNNVDKHTIVVSEPSENVRSHSTSLTLRQSRSGDAAPGRKARPNRRVSAAEAFESQHYQVEKTQPTFYEEEDGAITYTANLLGSRPRIMDVCIPKVNPDGAGMEWKRYLEKCKEHDPSNSADRLLNHLKQLQQNGEIDEHGRLINPANNNGEVLGTDETEYSPPGDFGLLALQNRPPWWNIELGSFVLNFGGRVSVASVKNFQLCDRSDQDYIMLQFGRIEGRHSFTMDFQHPLTAVQAFAIAISSLQSKISFG